MEREGGYPRPVLFFVARQPGLPSLPSQQIPTTISSPSPSGDGARAQTEVIINRTHVNMVLIPHPPVNDYMGWSIFNLICCNLFIGIFAVIYSSMTQDSVRSGNRAAAATLSWTARVMNITATVVGIICHIVWIAILIYFLVTAKRRSPSSSSSSSSY